MEPVSTPRPVIGYNAVNASYGITASVLVLVLRELKPTLFSFTVVCKQRHVVCMLPHCLIDMPICSCAQTCTSDYGGRDARA